MEKLKCCKYGPWYSQAYSTSIFQIWFPRLIFKNTLEETQTTLDDFAFLFAKPNSTSVISGEDQVKKIIVSTKHSSLLTQSAMGEAETVL